VSLFVTFEGPDGAGKSTQISLVAARLQNAGLDIVATREPGGTPLGERVRSVLLDPGESPMVPRAEALLMTAARSQHVAEVIRPGIERGSVVLCDRFVDSTLAYQGAGRGLPLNELKSLQSFAIGDVVPDLTVLLDIPADVGIERRISSGAPMNRLDQDELAFHERVREWYVQAARSEPGRWHMFDARRDAEELAEEITESILARLCDAGANRTHE
jgi:dTMP kinase